MQLVNMFYGKKYGYIEMCFFLKKKFFKNTYLI